uniref:mRNA decay factor PAT1 domain-containing protein n=1 Tax=Anopheles atroparvus TaxID=41427 RepID=A0AAG5D8B5_ANOAO
MDSFFGFDTSLLAASNVEGNDAGGGKRSPASRYFREDESDEEEYDALNDETFGSADNKGDWEHIHENLVRLESGVKEDDAASSELEDCHSRALQLEDYDLDLKFNYYDTNDESGRSSVGAQSIGDEFASKLRLDPSIWGSPLKMTPQSLHMNTAKLGRPSFTSGLTAAALPSGLTPPVKMLSVEDIERNILQQQQQQLKEHQQKLPPKSRETLLTSKEGTLKAQPIGIPPQLLAARNGLFPAVPGHNHSAHLLSQAGRLPLGMLPPYGLLSAAPFSGPINNLAMHPAFPHAALGPHGLPGLLPGPGPLGQQRHPVAPPPFLLQPSPVSTVQNNQFNQRLVQEIQQNHPLLAFNRQQQQLVAGTFSGNSNGSNNNTHHHQKHNSSHNVYHHYQLQQQQQQQQYRNSNGIPKSGPPIERDEYANLMSNREKQWLIGIQLTQLNSDWPFFSDYYFTMYKERLAVLEGDSHASRTYKDNQLNHPFTQPKGHAQLLLMSSMAKNAGMLNVAGRERKCSESKAGGGPASEAKDGGCTYAPLQFENSLGKLQCGSVTAPRKIIDMDVMGGDERDVNGNGINLEHTVSQRKTRQVLLLIETLYKMVLKLEDLLNPTAIEAITLLREKRERDRQCLANGGVDSFRGSVASLPEHTESFDELIAALIGSLSQDKTTSILSVRKGKILLRRILAVLRNHPFRWTLWAMIFNAIPWLPRKDRDDPDGLLFSLYAEFERHVQGGTVADLLRVSKTFDPSAGDGAAALMQCVATCKLLLSAIITIIFQMEVLYSKNPRTLDEEQDESSWVAFLQHANRIVVGKGTTTQANGSAPIQSSIRISPDNNIARTVRLHFDSILFIQSTKFGNRSASAQNISVFATNPPS